MVSAVPDELLEDLNEDQICWLRIAPVAHLATADASGAPNVIPVCYAFDGRHIYSVLDRKPKSVALTRLRRVRNIQENPRVSFVLDHYEDDWQRLGYLQVTGSAELLVEGDDRVEAVRLLREKYPQYRMMDVDDNPVIRITPDRINCWGSVPGN